jgi:hypothetical protein
MQPLLLGKRTQPRGWLAESLSTILAHVSNSDSSALLETLYEHVPTCN